MQQPARRQCACGPSSWLALLQLPSQHASEPHLLVGTANPAPKHCSCHLHWWHQHCHPLLGAFWRQGLCQGYRAAPREIGRQLHSPDEAAATSPLHEGSVALRVPKPLQPCCGPAWSHWQSWQSCAIGKRHVVHVGSRAGGQEKPCQGHPWPLLVLTVRHSRMKANQPWHRLFLQGSRSLLADMHQPSVVRWLRALTMRSLLVRQLFPPWQPQWS
mmetsp:Transcript_123104/g.245059  ORF Transcript_123104/g.245059 Transcript_123104/m.245059 type:complete len:215 (+) Transcript_123104:392-1036(+)